MPLVYSQYNIGPKNPKFLWLLMSSTKPDVMDLHACQIIESGYLNCPQRHLYIRRCISMTHGLSSVDLLGFGESVI